MIIVLLFMLFTANALAESGVYRLAPAETYRQANDYSGPYYSPENQRKRQQEQRGYYGYYDDNRSRYRYYRDRSYRSYRDSHSYRERSPSKPTPQVTPKPKPTPKVYRYYH